MVIFGDTWIILSVLVVLCFHLCTAAPTLTLGEVLGDDQESGVIVREYRMKRAAWDGLYFFPEDLLPNDYNRDRVSSDDGRANREKREVDGDAVEVTDPHVVSVVKRKTGPNSASRIDPGVIQVFTRSTESPKFTKDSSIDPAVIQVLRKRDIPDDDSNIDPEVIQIFKRSTGALSKYFSRLRPIDPHVILIPSKRFRMSRMNLGDEGLKSKKKSAIMSRLAAIDPDVIRVRRAAKPEKDGLFHAEGWENWGFVPHEEKTHGNSRQRRATENSEDEQDGLFHPIGWERVPF
ncbi:uncharacterized protein LOC106174741 [Lingula anatina]|uniref:Uncharacterized protein LOC106174741 n=1 Tax=Lingula anatina TaxID=7574 RepID=A0A1S3JP05_LINAN|nr:uncharacterized protein LOC106174741 [Lingula anatina]XP_013411871.1 uncharacterized protein LOC106174741 [Lingula anatina]|eukprot:XP_013411870.1 uncharacterized protein LOC106174741 [Lingula anatina]